MLKLIHRRTGVDGHAGAGWEAPSDCTDISHGSCLVSASMVFSEQNRDVDGAHNGKRLKDSLFGCPGGADRLDLVGAWRHSGMIEAQHC